MAVDVSLLDHGFSGFGFPSQWVTADPQQSEYNLVIKTSIVSNSLLVAYKS